MTEPKFQVINPANGQTVEDFDFISEDENQKLLEISSAAFQKWRFSDFKDRSRVLKRVAELHLEKIDELAEKLTVEMGKPISQARGEVSISADIYNFYADNIDVLLEDDRFEMSDGKVAFVKKVGLGPILGIMPWNFPYYQIARFAAPNIAAGNTVLVKPAPQCPLSALVLQEIFEIAGMINGGYSTLFLNIQQVAMSIGNPLIKGVSLTGSETAGRAVGEIASKNLKKIVMELGGSDALIVLDDADLVQAIKYALLNRFKNTGQSCNATKRIYVHKKIFSKFIESFKKAAKNIKVGEPLDDDTFMGPLSSKQALNTIEDQVSDAVSKGAKVILGGKSINGSGFWYEPTILTGVVNTMRAYHEELFGPVAVVHSFETEEEVLESVNESDYGLGAAIFSSDSARAMQIAEKIDVGMVHINGAPRFDPRFPFGGIKDSGSGRELGRYGIEEFTNKKLFYIDR